MAELAAQILALDVAGIDMVCRDIERPLAEQGGAIVEMLYPNDAPARIPIIAITGTNGKTTVTWLISHMYATARRVVGMTWPNAARLGRMRRTVDAPFSMPGG